MIFSVGVQVAGRLPGDRIQTTGACTPQFLSFRFAETEKIYTKLSVTLQMTRLLGNKDLTLVSTVGNLHSLVTA